MGSSKISLELFDMLKKTIPRKFITGVIKKYMKIDNNKDDIALIDPSLLTDNDDVIKIFNELQLNDPKKMAKFIIEVHLAEVECIFDNFNDLKELDLIRLTSSVRNALEQYQMAMKNQKDKHEILIETWNALNASIVEMEDKAIHYINETRKIDNLPKHKFFLISLFKLSSVRTNNKLAKIAIEAVIDSRTIEFAIGEELDWNVETIKDAFDYFKDRVLSDDNCSLMYNYDDNDDGDVIDYIIDDQDNKIDNDTDKNNSFWLNLEDHFKNSVNIVDLIKKIKNTSEDDDLDYDNIEFN